MVIKYHCNIPAMIIIATNLIESPQSNLGDLHKVQTSDPNNFDETQVRALFPLPTSQAGPEASRMAVNFQPILIFNFDHFCKAKLKSCHSAICMAKNCC